MSGPTDEFDQFRLPKSSAVNGKAKSPPTRSRDWFLKGPIPGAWLQIATGLPGRALHVGLALWFMCGLTKQQEVRVTRRVRQRFSIPQDAFQRGLQKLEAVGLVSVARQPGRTPLIAILDASEIDVD